MSTPLFWSGKEGEVKFPAGNFGSFFVKMSVRSNFTTPVSAMKQLKAEPQYCEHNSAKQAMLAKKNQHVLCLIKKIYIKQYIHFIDWKIFF